MKKAIPTNRKKLTSLLLAGVMTCTLPLTGCSNTKQPGADPTQGTPAATTAAPTEAPTTVAPTEAPTQAPTTETPTQAPTTEAPTTEVPTDPEVLKDVSLTGQYNAFTMEVLKRSIATTDKNVMVSPLSIMVALSMTANGASGETAEEMRSVLGGKLSMEQLNQALQAYCNSLPSTDKVKLARANAIWYMDSPETAIREDFLKLNQKYYSAGLFPTDFGPDTVNDINNWVSKNTDGMIKKLVEDLSPDCRMVLVNAILFDGKWAEEYYDDDIIKRTFTNADKTKVEADMMLSTENKYLCDKNCTGFMKYYEGNRYAFVGLLPNEGTTPDELIANMTADSLHDLLAGASSREVHVRIPKFSFDYGIEMNDVLIDMGIQQAFDPNVADFSGMSEKERLFISKVIHKSRVEVSEKGTRAAAATAVIMDRCTAVMPEPVLEVFLDRPFVFMIVDTEQNLPIFIGRVNTLTEE
ncbi:MAG: hypothetical protein IK125_07845 [Lachnospiraceae bacterium]|nr:hypothetical protein [Lachnospiraceae bacterium]